MDKVVVVIKDTREDVALERFIFSIQSMVTIEPYNKDTRSVCPIPVLQLIYFIFHQVLKAR